MAVLAPIIVAGGLTSIAVVSTGALTGGPAIALHSTNLPNRNVEQLEAYLRQEKVHAKSYTIPYSYDGKTHDVCYRIFEHRWSPTTQIQEVRILTSMWANISRQKSQQELMTDFELSWKSGRFSSITQQPAEI